MVSHTNVKRALAIRLRELRHSKGWSQERLAEAADMHRTYLAGIERSLRNPALENLVKLANALGVTMAELFSPGMPQAEASERQQTGGKIKRAPNR